MHRTGVNCSVCKVKTYTELTLPYGVLYNVVSVVGDTNCEVHVYSGPGYHIILYLIVEHLTIQAR